MGKTSSIDSQADFLRRDHSYRYFLISAISLTCAVTAAFIGLSSRPVTYLLVFLLFIATLVPLILAIRRKSFDCFEPVYVLSFLYFLYFVLRSVFVLNTDWDPRLDFFSVINTALVYVLAGFCVLLVGYYSQIPPLLSRKLPILNLNTNLSRMKILMFVFWLVSSLIFIYNIKTGVYTKWMACKREAATASLSFSDYLANQLAMFAYIFALILYFSNKRTRAISWFLWAIVIPSQSIYIFLTGEKKMFVYMILIYVMVYHYLRKRIKLTRLLVILLLIVFIVFPVFNAYRKVKFSGLHLSSFFQDINYIRKQTISNLDVSSTSEYAGDSFGKFMWRFPGIDAVSAVIMSIPDRIDYQHGRTFLKFFVVPIPNFILKNKGEYIRQGELFNPTFFGYWTHKDSILVPVGELYLNFKFPGVIIGMFILGVMFRVFYIHFRKTPLPMAIFVYIFVWLAIMNVESDLGIVYGNLLRQLILIFVVLRLMNRGGLFVARQGLQKFLYAKKKA